MRTQPSLVCSSIEPHVVSDFTWRSLRFVVGIVSFYKKVPFTSASQYECHEGALMSGVAFKGTMAKVAGR